MENMLKNPAIENGKTAFLKTRREKILYIQFVSSIYRQNKLTRDSLSLLLKNIIMGKSCFCKYAKIFPIAFFDDAGQIICAATFIIADKMADTLQIAFLEMTKNDPRIFSSILHKAREKACEFNAVKIVAGLNGHVNNGMGFLVDHFDCQQSFGSPYNSPQLIDALTQNGGRPDYQVSFLIKTRKAHGNWQNILKEKSNSQITYRTADFKALEKEIRIYTDLNNAIFKDHPLYYERSYEEDMELFKSFSWLMREENLIIAQDKTNRPVGFLLWYPDFNQLMKPGETLGLKTVLKRKFFAKPMDRFKIVEIGILPEYQGENVSWGMLQKCASLTHDKFSSCETGWIFDNNLKSRGLAETWEGPLGDCINLFKKYAVFHFDVC